jgi:uncharacterized surface protein with fasciclin (FAS1) repeats
LAGEFLLAVFQGIFMDQLRSVPATEGARDNTTGPANDILNTVIGAGNFTTFVSSVKSAGLTDALNAKGPFTVFAPTDEAFRKLPSGAHEALMKDSAKLKAVLNYHIVSGYLNAKDVKPGEMMTLQGTTLTAVVSSADVRVNGARITQADIAATNGIVHAIDTVILPKNWQLLAVAA